MRSSVLALCVLVGAVIGAAAPKVAEARSCTDRAFSWVRLDRSSNIPQTRRIKRIIKPQSLVRAGQRTLQIKHAAALSVARAVGIRAVDRTSRPDVLEELELESVAWDVVLDDPQRTMPAKLRPSRGFVLFIVDDREAPRPALEGFRLRVDRLRARLLPKIPAASDDSASIS